MTVSANIWQARAAMCELLALSFRYPEDKVLAEAIASGEWGEAADEIAGALGIDWTAAAAPVPLRPLRCPIRTTSRRSCAPRLRACSWALPRRRAARTRACGVRRPRACSRCCS